VTVSVSGTRRPFADPGRDRVLQLAERASDRDDRRAHGDVVAVREDRGLQVLRRHLQDRDIGLVVAPDELHVLDHTVVGEDHVE
jgi:hypothetical protein